MAYNKIFIDAEQDVRLGVIPAGTAGICEALDGLGWALCSRTE